MYVNILLTHHMYMQGQKTTRTASLSLPLGLTCYIYYHFGKHSGALEDNWKSLVISNSAKACCINRQNARGVIKARDGHG